MASQADKWSKAYNEYVSRPIYDPRVAEEMYRALKYANTVDTEAAATAVKILNGTN